MRLRRQPDVDRVTGADLPASQHDRHDACLAHEGAFFVPVQHGLHEPWPEPVKLDARIAQPSDLDQRAGAEQQPGTGREPEQVNAAGRHVLAHVAWRYLVPEQIQFVMQFGVDQMYLAQVRRIRIAGDPGQVLDRATRVHVAFDAESGYEFDRIPDRLAEGVPAVTADGGHEACWHRHRGSGYHTRGINRAVRLA